MEKEEGQQIDNQRADELRAYDLLVQRHINDDRLRAERVSIFLLSSSFLFLGFVGLLDVLETFKLRLVIPAIGIVLCFVVFVSGWRTSRGLDFWVKAETKIEQEGSSFQYMRERKIGCKTYGVSIAPHNVFEHLKRAKLGCLLGKRVLGHGYTYTYVLPLLFLILWGISLAWVICNW